MSSFAEAQVPRTQEERRRSRGWTTAATLCLAAVPFVVGVLLLAEVVGSTTPLQKLWGELGLGAQSQVWPPPGTFLPAQPAATPGSFFPGGSVNGSVSRVAMFNISWGLVQVELGTPTTKYLGLETLSEFLTLAPGQSLPTTYGVGAVASWMKTGVVAGTLELDTGAGTVEVWDAAAVQQGAAAKWRLPASGEVRAILTLPNGGIIAGIWNASGALNIWPNRTAVEQQSSPVVLLPGLNVFSLLMLPSGAVAVGTETPDGAGSVLIWSSFQMLLQGLPANRTLYAPGAVGAMLALPSGGLAAGIELPNNSGTVEVWLNASAVETGKLTARLTSPGCYVTSLLHNSSDGALVAGVASPLSGGGLAVWPNTSFVLQGGPALRVVGSVPINSVVQLPGEAIAAAAIGSVYLWSSIDAVLAGDPPTVSLQAPGQISALLALPGGGLAAGAENANDPTGGAGALSLWPYLTPLLQSAKGSRLQASNQVNAVLSLADGGLAAGTQGADLVSGTVDVWRTLDGSKVSLPASGCVYALLELASGDLVAGTVNVHTCTGNVDIWPNRSQLHEGGGPKITLPASGGVFALLLLSSGWLAAGTQNASGFGTVDLWLLAELRDHQRPVARLMASGWVNALLELPGGGVAAGVQNMVTSAGAVDIWPYASSLFDGAHPVLSIPVSATEFVNALANLSSGGIAAATTKLDFTCGSLVLWPSLAALLQGERPIRVLSLSARGVLGLAPLPFGGLAAATFSAYAGQGSVMLWPEGGSLAQRQPPLLQLQASDLTSLALLAGGGIAAGTNQGTVDLWPSTISQVGSAMLAPAGAVYVATELLTGIALGTMTAQGPVVEIWLSQPSGGFNNEASVALGSIPLAILQLSSGHLAVGTLNGTIQFFTPDWAPAATIPCNGSVRALVQLPAGGFAAAVDGTSSSLVLWATLHSALYGPQPDRIVALALPPRALLWVGGSLLIGETTGVELWTPSGQQKVLLNTSRAVSVLKALPGGGLAIGGDDYLVQIWRVASDVLLGRPSDLVVAVPALAASIAVLEDGSLAAGGAVFTPVKCPAGDFSTGGRFLNCTPCRPGWLSEPGAASCGFAPPSSIAVAAGAVAACLLLGLGLAQLLLFTLRRHGSGRWEIDVARKSLVAGAAVTSVIFFSMREEQWVQLISLLLSCGLLFFAPNSDNRYLALGLLVLNLALAAQTLQAPRGHEVLTVVGQLTGPAPGAGLLLCLSLLFAGAAYALPDVKTLAGERARPAPGEHPLEVWRGASAASQSFEMHTVVEQPARPRCRCSCLAALCSAAAPAMRLGSSFAGEHGAVLAFGLVTVGQMGWQLTQNSATAAASAGLILLAIVVAAAQCASSTLAILVAAGFLPRRLTTSVLRIVDRHLRLAVVLKYVALALKLMVMVLPYQTPERDVYLWWQCQTPALCPHSCTKNRGGTCGTATSSNGSPACICMAFEDAKVLILLNCLPAPFVSLGVTVVNSLGYFRSERFAAAVPLPRMKVIAQMILALVPPLLQAIFLFLIYKVPASCLAVVDVAIIIYPALLLGLLANEAKRALQGWGNASFSTCFSDSLLLSLRPFAVVVAAIGAVAAGARAKGLTASSWPDLADCSESALPWAVIAALLTMGSMAAASLGPVAAPERPSGAGSTVEEPIA